MLDWVNAHGLIVLGLYWLFSSAVGAMPAPSENSSGFYHWVYGFGHNLLQLVAANGARIPQVRSLLGISSETTAASIKLATAEAKDDG